MQQSLNARKGLYSTIKRSHTNTSDLFRPGSLNKNSEDGSLIASSRVNINTCVNSEEPPSILYDESPLNPMKDTSSSISGSFSHIQPNTQSSSLECLVKLCRNWDPGDISLNFTMMSIIYLCDPTSF